MLKIREFESRPVRGVRAVQYDGSFDQGEELIRWILSSPTNQRMHYENETRLVMHDREGTSDIFEGWWVIQLANGTFTIMDTDEFANTYRPVDSEWSPNLKRNVW